MKHDTTLTDETRASQTKLMNNSLECVHFSTGKIEEQMLSVNFQVVRSRMKNKSLLEMARQVR